MTMFDEYSIEVNDNFNEDVVDRADEEFTTDSPVQIVARWESDTQIDLNGAVFDVNGNLMEVASFDHPDALNGLLKLSGEVKGGKKKGNAQALTVDWTGLSITNAGFVAIVVHTELDHTLADAKGCELSCEWNGQVFFDKDLSDAMGTGYFWGFAFKDDSGQWWFLEMNAAVSG